MSLDWLILILFVGLLVYTMIVIREEKASYRDSAVDYSLGPICFPAPSWWGLVKSSDNELIFERTDTRYDWRARLAWLAEPEWEDAHQLSLPELFTQLIKQRELEFDEIQSVIHEPESFQSHPLVASGAWEICRVEGTASKAVVERVYYDAYLIRDHELQRYLYCESESSVLNGLVEGPYFEEMMSLVRKD